ncbi:hypothetical protein JKP88DRAFT_261309 [Tribonema minus]|uniref:RRM domain-containing protein n=1 Tax=Tribonema minus TaxID=303371 RepID=A0A835YND0_9STRA|nr:hypothetical protein JKP88DRAFT_261309 [Tribonema minus]
MDEEYKPGQLGQLFAGVAPDPNVATLFSDTKKQSAAFKRVDNAPRITPEEAAEVARVLKEAEKRHAKREKEADPDARNKEKKEKRVRLTKEQREAAEAAAAASAAADTTKAGGKAAKKRKLAELQAEAAAADAAGSDADSDLHRNSDDGPDSDRERGAESEDEGGGGDVPQPGTVAQEAPLVGDKTEAADLEARTVFVGNVPVKLKRDKIASFFKEYGKVETVLEAGNQALMRKACIATGKINEKVKDSVNAYIVFQDAESARAALAANGRELNGHHLRVDSAARPTVDPARSVFLGNLPFDVREEEVRAHFSEISEDGTAAIEGVRLIRDPDTQLGKGFGYVLFRDAATVGAALRLDGSALRKRELRVHVCGRRTKGGRGGRGVAGGAAVGGGAAPPKKVSDDGLRTAFITSQPHMYS